MKDSNYYFLASPYNGTEEEKKARHQLSKKIATTFLENEISLFAPILYNQSMIDYFPAAELENRRKLLMPMNIDFLYGAKAVILLKLSGWNVSWGISQYLKVCSKENIDIYELEEENLDQNLLDLVSTLKSNPVLPH